jgi:hypothetical protein
MSHPTQVIQGESRTVMLPNVPSNHPAFHIKSGDHFYYTPNTSSHHKRWFHALVVAAQNFANFDSQGAMTITIKIRLLIQWDPEHRPPLQQHHPRIERDYTIEIQHTQSLPNPDPYPWHFVINRITPTTQLEQNPEDKTQTRLRKIWSSISRLVQQIFEKRTQRLGSIDHLDQMV